MFVSIAIDPGSEERAKELAELLIQYGFEKIQRGLWESTAMSPETLVRVKRDLDHGTDAFDKLRIFQFPIDGTLVLSTLKEKKWRRLIAKGGETASAPAPKRPAAPPQRTASPQGALPQARQRTVARPARVRSGRRATDL